MVGPLTGKAKPRTMLCKVRGARYFQEDCPQGRPTRLGRLVWRCRMLQYSKCFRPTGADRSFKTIWSTVTLEFASPCTLCCWRLSPPHSGLYHRQLKLSGRTFAAKEYRVGKDLVDQRTCLQAQRRNFGTRRRGGDCEPMVMRPIPPTLLGVASLAHSLGGGFTEVFFSFFYPGGLRRVFDTEA